MSEVDDLHPDQRRSDHIIEPPDLFVHHLAAEYGVVRQAGTQRRGERRLDLRAGRDGDGGTQCRCRPTRRSMGSSRRASKRCGPVYDVHERVKDMDAGGVLASMNFPYLPTFGTDLCERRRGRPLALVRAYNDWHIDEWCATYPARFIPMAVPVIWDAQATAESAIRREGLPLPQLHGEPRRPRPPELPRRVLGPGVAGMLRHGDGAGHPPGLVRASLHSRRRFAAGRDDHPAADEHPIGGGGAVVVPGAQDLPDLRVALSEGGTGWVPYFLSRVDRTFGGHVTTPGRSRTSAARSERGVPGALPDACIGGADRGSRDEIGVDNIAWEADYPHGETVSPNAPEELGVETAKYAVPGSDVSRMTHERHALVLLRPLRPHAKEEATVAALRRRAASDVSIMSRSTRVRTPDEKLGVGTGARRAVAAAGELSGSGGR